ncbi:MAG TPA: TetR/AcrR family transcriptional regulator [Verrucomicrobiae bacterium]|jgi:TetR/AcrR family transcriptional repressor of nem operon
MGRVSEAKVKLMDAVLELIWTGSYGSTTIDQICERAGVKKGSFYYFFNSKSELAVEALGSSWQSMQAEVDRMFSATIPPLDRLQKYCDFSYKFQCDMKAKYGRVLGCPQFSLGSEVCTQDDTLQKKIQSILDYKRKYIESAIRDGIASGDVPACDPSTKAQMVMAYYEGMLMQARIKNDVGLLSKMATGVFSLLGVKDGALATV